MNNVWVCISMNNKIFSDKRKTTKKILLDTSFILLSFQLNLDFINELKATLGNVEICIYDKVLEEIKRISSERSQRGVIAKITYYYIQNLINNKKIKYICKENEETTVDVLLLKEAIENDAFIATVDMRLRRKAKKENIRTIYIRKTKKRIEID